MAGTAALGELSEAPPTGLSLAQPADDAPLRALLRRSVLPGPVRVALTREPCYAAGEGLAGAEDTTLVSRRDGRIAGIGRCSVNTLMLDGRASRVGYLAELRVVPGSPGAPRMLREGYEYLETHVVPTLEACFTSIGAGNERARRVLERGARFGLPAYRRLGDLVTLVAPIPPMRIASTEREVIVDEDALLAFLRVQSARSRLGLAWTDVQWNALSAHGIDHSSFVVVMRDRRVAGAAAIWDQRAFRQVVVDGYDGALRYTRPLVNVALALRGEPRLPPPGSVLAQGMLLGAAVVDPSDWPALWAAIAHRAAGTGLRWLVVSRAAGDPEIDILRRTLHGREYRTTLYDVRWRSMNQRGLLPPGEARPLRPEVSLL